jgi:dihydrofolate reductase
MRKRKLKAILAKNNLSFIGLTNGLPWKPNKEDFKHFKDLTNNSVLLVGYNTFQTLPLLKNREIILDNNDVDLSSIDWCIGGKRTYEKYCHLFDELHISHINDNTIGDTLFPDFSNLNPNCKIFNYYF